MRDGTLTRKRLERCALTLFVEQGIHATTIKDIATSAGIAEGTLYRHYTSKEELAESLFLKAHESIANHVKKEIEKFSSLKDKLKFMVHFFCEKYDEDPIVFNYLLLAQHHQMQILKKADYSAHAQLVSVVNEAIKKKELFLCFGHTGHYFASGIESSVWSYYSQNDGGCRRSRERDRRSDF